MDLKYFVIGDVMKIYISADQNYLCDYINVGIKGFKSNNEFTDCVTSLDRLSFPMNSISKLRINSNFFYHLTLTETAAFLVAIRTWMFRSFSLIEVENISNQNLKKFDEIFNFTGFVKRGDL